MWDRNMLLWYPETVGVQLPAAIQSLPERPPKVAADGITKGPHHWHCTSNASTDKLPSATASGDCSRPRTKEQSHTHTPRPAIAAYALTNLKRLALENAEPSSRSDDVSSTRSASGQPLHHSIFPCIVLRQATRFARCARWPTPQTHVAKRQRVTKYNACCPGTRPLDYIESTYVRSRLNPNLSSYAMHSRIPHRLLVQRDVRHACVMCVPCVLRQHIVSAFGYGHV